MPEDASSQAPGGMPERKGVRSRTESDDDLVVACLRGDVRAWDALIQRYQGFILSIALRRGLSRSDAEDVFQNVCVKLYEHLSDLRDVSKLPGWLAAVTSREAGLLYRKDSVRLFTETELLSGEPDASESLLTSHENSPEEELLAAERREVVQRMLGELSGECRSLLTMIYAMDPPKSYNEVSTELNMPLGSIGPKRARCLSRLRALLERVGY